MVDAEIRDIELRKYPRTPHLLQPRSPGASADDRIQTTEQYRNMLTLKDIVVTEKMDGGNLTFTRDHFFGRSLDSGTHHWDSRARALWAEKHFDIPKGWRVSGESMYARRSVSYDDLPDIYMVFGIWDEGNTLLSWDDMVAYADLMGLTVVPLIYRGGSYSEAVSAWGSAGFEDGTSEGFVVRNAGSFDYGGFGMNVGKWVRENHVRTRADWRHRDDYASNTFVD